VQSGPGKTPQPARSSEVPSAFTLRIPGGKQTGRFLLRLHIGLPESKTTSVHAHVHIPQHIPAGILYEDEPPLGPPWQVLLSEARFGMHGGSSISMPPGGADDLLWGLLHRSSISRQSPDGGQTRDDGWLSFSSPLSSPHFQGPDARGTRCIVLHGSS